MRSDTQILAWLRRALLWTLLAGLMGTGTELILLGHVESAAQFIPLALIVLALVAALWHATAASSVSVRALKSVMVLCLVGGVLGVGLHYRGNLEFELELYPEMSGVELVTKVVTGATPVLAPGALSLLGLIGLLHAYRHPAAARRTAQEDI
jgi:hypothetical protein